MKTIQLLHSFRFLYLIFLLFFTNIVIGQSEDIILNDLSYNFNKGSITFSGLKNNYNILPSIYNKINFQINKALFNNSNGIVIKGIKENGISKDSVKIKIYDPVDEIEKQIMIKKEKVFPQGTFFDIPNNIEIHVKTPNGYNMNCDSNVKFLSDNENGKERIRIIKGSCIVEKVHDSNKSNTSNEVAANDNTKNTSWFSTKDSGTQAGPKGTSFLIKSDSIQFKVKLNNGHVSIHNLTKIKINEKIATNQDEHREIFITSFSDLKENKVTDFSRMVDSISTIQLNNESSIDSLFKKEYLNQKRLLRNGGPYSRLGFKLLEQGTDSIVSDSDSLGISLGIINYKTAIKNGEIDREHFIQAALILSEAKFRKAELKGRSNWLDAALYFINIQHEYNKSRFEKYKNAKLFDLAKGFGKDLVISNEYHVWAYTVKLMINGCLENTESNPQLWRDRAKDIKCKLNNKTLECD